MILLLPKKILALFSLLGSRLSLASVFLVVSFLSLLPGIASAKWCLEVGLGVPGLSRGSCVDLKTYVDGVYKLAGTAVGIVGVLMFLVGGFQYMVSAGNKSVASEAKKTMVNAVIGIILVYAAYLFLRTINIELVDNQALQFD